MSYSVHPVTLHALIRDGQQTPVAIYHTAHEAQEAAKMLTLHEGRDAAGEPYRFSDWARLPTDF
jgi:hypothetical protein